MNLLGWLAGVGLSLGAVAACSSDDAVDPAPTGTGATAGTGGTGGTGGAGGTGAIGGMGGAAGGAGGASAKKWHPGHYMQTLRNSYYRVQANRFAIYDAIATNQNIVGVAHMFDWRELQTTPGDFSQAVNLIQSEIDYLSSLSHPKRFLVRMNTVAWHDTCAQQDVLPDFAVSSGYVWDGANGCAFALWETGGMDLYLPLIEAIAASFDDNEYFGGFQIIKETAPLFGGSSPASFTWEKYATELQRAMTALDAAGPRNNYILTVNWFFGPIQGLFDHMVAERIAKGNPDTCDPCDMPGDTYYVGQSGTTDYRGVIPAMMSVEVSELGYNSVGPAGGFTAQEIFDFNDDTLHASHIFWDRNDIPVGSIDGTLPLEEQTWGGTNGILDTIAANPLTHTEYPTAYP